MSREDVLTQQFHAHQNKQGNSNFLTAGEALSVKDKIAILDQRGQSDLIEIFKGWKPRVAAGKRKGAPLDQRVSIALSPRERAILDGEIRAIKETGQSTSLGALIRSRAMASPNLADWRETAWLALDELDSIVSREKELKEHKKNIQLALENTEIDQDDEEVSHLERELLNTSKQLSKLVSSPLEKRTTRLQGRMTYAEAETVKWRAQRLCLTTTDYLRMLIFDQNPNGHSDMHMNLAGRRRFYVSIVDVADNGWGDAPGVYKCSQCESYAEEIAKLRERLRQYETFSN